VELRQLDMIRTVADSGGYKRAGELLHLSHPAVHRQIRMLEEELGERVFRRVGRGVQPTEAGRRLMALADRIHREIGSALSEIRDISELERGGFRLGTATWTWGWSSRLASCPTYGRRSSKNCSTKRSLCWP
jgi:LysR family cyn operon transcriptional activator